MDRASVLLVFVLPKGFVPKKIKHWFSEELLLYFFRNTRYWNPVILEIGVF